jgi:hypothetical protein
MSLQVTTCDCLTVFVRKTLILSLCGYCVGKACFFLGWCIRLPHLHPLPLQAVLSGKASAFHPMHQWRMYQYSTSVNCEIVIPLVKRCHKEPREAVKPQCFTTVHTDVMRSHFEQLQSSVSTYSYSWLPTYWLEQPSRYQHMDLSIYSYLWKFQKHQKGYKGNRGTVLWVLHTCKQTQCTLSWKHLEHHFTWSVQTHTHKTLSLSDESQDWVYYGVRLNAACQSSQSLILSLCERSRFRYLIIYYKLLFI